MAELRRQRHPVCRASHPLGVNCSDQGVDFTERAFEHGNLILPRHLQTVIDEIKEMSALRDCVVIERRGTGVEA